MSDESDFSTPGSSEAGRTASDDVLKDEAQVAFEIEFFGPVLARCPDFVEVLQLLAGHYTRVGRYEDGLAIDRRLVRLCPEDAIAHYNLACSLSLTHKPTAAVRELDRAVRLGYRDVAHIERDTDLDNLRQHPAYLTLMRRLRRT